MSFTKSLALGLALALAACSGGSSNDAADPGDATVVVNVRQDALTGATAGIVWLNLVGVTDPAFNRWFPATPVDGSHTFRLNALRTGDYTATVLAFVDNAVDPTVPPAPPADWATPAPVALTVNRGLNTFATIWLQQTLPADTVANVASMVNSVISSLFTVDSFGTTAEPVTLDVTMSDANGDSIQYAWGQTFVPASVAQGTFAPAASGVIPGAAPAATLGALRTTYTAPTGYAGDVTLSLTITDGNAASPVSSVVAIPLRVGNFGRGNVAIPVQINGLPNIISFSSTKGMLLPDGADTAVITLDANDDAIDTLVATFTLSGAGCGTLGAVSSNKLGNDTTFQAVYTASTVAGSCLISASVTDGNPGTTPTVASLGLNQAANPVSYAPAFALFSPDNLTPVVVNVDPLLGAPAVQFSVDAVDPFTGAPILAVVYTTTDAPSAILPLPIDPATPGTMSATYLTDACLAQAPGTVLSFTVTATATNPATGATSAVIWPITVNCL